MLVSLPSLSNIAGNNMARQIRKKSGTGIYHVMLRGINRQDISMKAGIVENIDEVSLEQLEGVFIRQMSDLVMFHKNCVCPYQSDRLDGID